MGSMLDQDPFSDFFSGRSMLDQDPFSEFFQEDPTKHMIKVENFSTKISRKITGKMQRHLLDVITIPQLSL